MAARNSRRLQNMPVGGLRPPVKSHGLWTFLNSCPTLNWTTDKCIPVLLHKTNDWILGKLKVDRELLDRVKSLKLGFYGHTTPKYESLEKEMVQGCVPGYRNRGRQRRRWTDDISEWTGMKINETAAAAEDRDRWREILRAANTSHGGRHWTTTTTVTRRRCTCMQHVVKPFTCIPIYHKWAN